METVNWWDVIEWIASVAGPGLLFAASIAVWRIHKRHENVRMHKIGKMTWEEMDLLRDGIAFFVQGELHTGRGGRKDEAAYLRALARLVTYGLMVQGEKKYRYSVTVYGDAARREQKKGQQRVGWILYSQHRPSWVVLKWRQLVWWKCWSPK